MTTFKDTKPIDIFDGTEYDFLSNFHPAQFTYRGIVWTTSEHAYQAMKSKDRKVWLEFSKLAYPGQAKRKGNLGIRMRKDWDQIKQQVMAEVIKAKFTQNPDLREKLLATGTRELIEGNTWNDTYWGVCRGVGTNHLGKLLMALREELRS